jgi:hypothetical protein
MADTTRIKGLPVTGGLPEKALLQKPVFVDSNSGNSGNTGKDPDRPVDSISNAFLLNKVAANGLIIVAPGHSETVTAANGILCDIAGVHVKGYGEGAARPTINFTTVVGADIEIDAANITFENLYFDATGIDALTGPIDVDAAYFTLRNCEVLLADSGGQCSDFLVGDANADYLLVKDCIFRASTDAGPQSAIQVVGSDSPMILNNRIYGDFAASPFENETTACTRVNISDNKMDNYNANDFCITLVATTDGDIADNRLRIATNGQTSWITPTNDCSLYENYGVNADSETGMLIGTASS